MVGGGAPVSGWQPLDGSARAPGAADRRRRRRCVVANVAGDLLAYRNRCAGCGGALDHGDLSGGTLHLPDLRAEVRPAARRAAASEDGLQLEPVPLLRDGDTVRVAVA